MTSLGLLIIALSIAWLAIRPRRRFAANFLLTIGFLTLVAPQTPWFPQALIYCLLKPLPSYTQYAWSDSNVIVLLGGGIEVTHEHRYEASQFTRSRTLAAITAYYSCKSNNKICIVIASGGDPNKEGMTEAACMKDLLIHAGIPDNDIKTEELSNNTFENARYSALIIQRQFAGSKIFLTTSALHMRRSLLYFSHFNIDATPIISEWNFSRWGLKQASYNAFLTDRALAEFWGIERYYIYNFLGLNPKK